MLDSHAVTATPEPRARSPARRARSRDSLSISSMSPNRPPADLARVSGTASPARPRRSPYIRSCRCKNASTAISSAAFMRTCRRSAGFLALVGERAGAGTSRSPAGGTPIDFAWVQSMLRNRSLTPIRICERVLNRHPHVCRADLRQHAAVSVYSIMACTVDCGWTTTSTWDGAKSNKPARLDHLEALVHQRSRVYSDAVPMRHVG